MFWSIGWFGAHRRFAVRFGQRKSANASGLPHWLVKGMVALTYIEHRG